MKLKIGLEQEFFVQNKSGDFQVMTDKLGIPFDGCRLLAESRGNPADSAREAVFNLLAENYRVDKLCKSKGMELICVPHAKVPREVHLEAFRQPIAKSPASYQNSYGHKDHNTPECHTTASIHISFTNQGTFRYNGATEQAAVGGPRFEAKCFNYNKIWDFSKLFKHLDEQFAEEIKSANRLPGFYEIKEDGRIEYRSLPTTTDHYKIIQVLEDYMK